MSLLKQHQLRALAAVADQGSINAAARALCVSQPAITKALRELEMEQGVPLLLRSAQGAALTDAGQLLLGYARLVIRELERAQQEMERLRFGRERSLRIGMTPLAGLELLPAAFLAFRRFHPDVQVSFLELDTVQMLDGLRSGQLDFALGAFVDPPESAHVLSTSLYEFATTFAVRSESPLSQARSLSELQGAEWMHADASGMYPRFVQSLFAQAGLPPPERITCCTSNVLFCGLLMGMDMVVPMSSLGMRATLTAQRFSELNLEVSPPGLTLMLLEREGAIMSRAAERMMDCIRAALA
ncbi:LysR substrate-binding domain-containing protein [Chromobacterium haemolyticum]|uniref:LysR substrate-binding domain-containing protein n=1 Tax=Chromobacterium haemolyticum TaxID=394935 RepID=UPI000694F105|nr:LysR substrate-binding domain-containing protein [Chromobacterium haemolyticum]